MNPQPDLVAQASEFVRTILQSRLPSHYVYHNFERTKEVAKVCGQIAGGMKLKKRERELALLAAWFHDVGYVEGEEGHEEQSIVMATKFLQDHRYQMEDVDRIAGCIRATKLPLSPQSPLEEIVCDATVVATGKKRFLEVNELLRVERERVLSRSFTDSDWLKRSIEYLTQNSFHTKYAQKQFGKRRNQNLVKLQEELRRATAEQSAGVSEKRINGELKSLKLKKEKRPERGIETMFRITSRNHIDLGAMADRKANIMISVNALIISLVISLLLRNLNSYPHLIIPTFLLIGVCLTAMIFATLSTMPKVTSGIFTREDIEQKRTNLLFFGNFYNMSLEDFEWGMKEMMNDREYLYGSMIKDIYFLGQVLGRKYKYLRASYTVFMFGLIVSVAAFVIGFLATE